MEVMLNNTLLVGSALLLLSIFLSKSSSKFGLPILILFLFVGILVGSEGFGGIEYENYELTHSLSLVAICVIIFSGGLLTDWDSSKKNIKQGVLLSSFGVILTAFMVGGFSYFIFDLSVIEAMLIGSILSSTDAAAVFSFFRGKNTYIPDKVKNLIELESGSNDPMAYFLVSFFLDLYLNPNMQIMSFGPVLLFNPLIGIMGGVLFFKAFKLVNDHLQLDFQGLYPALTVGFLFLNFSVVTSFGGSGLLSVYIFGILVGNHKIVHKNALLAFFDGASWLFQIGLFVTLGLLVSPSRLFEVDTQAVALAVFMLFIARPLSVYLSLGFSPFQLKEKSFIAWAGLKGATPIVFASLVASQMSAKAYFIFDVVFFSVLISALFQGVSLKLFARFLGFAPAAALHSEKASVVVGQEFKSGIKHYQVKSSDFAVGKRVVDLELPKGAIVLFIKREEKILIPNGSSLFQSNDKVLLVTEDKQAIEEVLERFQVQTKPVDEVCSEQSSTNHLLVEQQKVSSKAA